MSVIRAKLISRTILDGEREIVRRVGACLFVITGPRLAYLGVGKIAPYELQRGYGETLFR
jgi:hypothetical protein